MQDKGHYDSLNEILVDFTAKGLIGKTPSEISIKHPTEYHRVYRFANKNKIKPTNIWVEIGLDVRRETYDRNIEELTLWVVKKSFGGKHFLQIPIKSRNRIKHFAIKSKIELSDLCTRLGISTNVIYVYDSIEEIIDDIFLKGLKGKTPNELINYDSSVTYANIKRFTERKKHKLVDIWKIIGIRHSDTVEIRDNKVVRKFAYYSVEEILNDLKKKGLIGMTPTDIQKFDSSKTFGNITTFAKRGKIKIVDLWEQLGIKPIDKSTLVKSPKIVFNSVEEIKKSLEKLKMPEKSLKAFRVADKKMYKAILDYAKKQKMKRGEIWKELEMDTLFVANSIEDIIALLKENDLLKASVAEIRKNGHVHDSVYLYAKKNFLKMSTIWKVLGIKNAFQLKSEKKITIL